MKNNFTRHDFLIKDVAVSIPGGNGHASTWMPTDDQHTPPSPISPIASVMANIGLIEAVRGTIAEAVKAQKFDDVARAFVPGEAGAALSFGPLSNKSDLRLSPAPPMPGWWNRGLVDGEHSFETIPSTLTPVVHAGFQVHRVTELPRLRKQLEQAVDYVNKAATAQAPGHNEVDGVRAQLKEALSSL